MAAPTLLVGPVIGKVTDTTARVLLELDVKSIVEVVLTPASIAPDDADTTPSTDAVVFTGSFEADIPAVVQCTDLQPATKYDVTVRVPDGDALAHGVGSFTTLPGMVYRLRTGAAACDKPTKRGVKNMWEVMYERHIADSCPDPLQLLIHHGDQVYADKAFVVGKRILDDASDTRPLIDKQRDCVMAYQRIYRATWSKPETRRVLANVPNLMIWDDHEVRNDWGSHLTDRDPESQAYCLGLCARQAYWWYQRQLWADLPPVLAPPTAAGAEAMEAATGADAADHVAAGDGLAVEDLDGGEHTGLTTAGTAGAGAGAGAGADGASGYDAAALDLTDAAAAGGGAGEAKEETKAAAADHAVMHATLAHGPSAGALGGGGWMNNPAGVDSEFHLHIMPGGRVAVMFVDMRGSRSFHYHESRPFFGAAQWREIEQALVPDGALADVGSLLVVHTSPVVFLTPSSSSKCCCLSRDKMGAALYPDSQRQYLDLLCDWAARPLPGAVAVSPRRDVAAPAARSVLALGGDMHFAMRTVIKRDGTPMFEQLTTSALSNTPPFWFVYCIYKAAMKCSSSLGGGLSFAHSDFHPDQNFAVIDAEWANDTAPSVKFEVVKARSVCCNYRGCCYW